MTPEVENDTLFRKGGNTKPRVSGAEIQGESLVALMMMIGLNPGPRARTVKPACGFK